MKERERAVVSGLVVLMLALWLGFVFHRSPRFAGSLWGGVLGVSGALMMLVPLAYLAVKRNKWLKRRATKRVSMRTLLAWHIYAGTVGPILVLLHTGHKFVSPLGIALTAMTLIVVLSGFVGRYLMNRISTEIRDKKAMLAKLDAQYQQAANTLANRPQLLALGGPFRQFFGRLVASLFVHDVAADSNGTTSVEIASPFAMLDLSQSIADVEYSIKTHATFKKLFGKWLKLHIAISAVLYTLLALHVWGAIHFGLRWFDSSTTSTPYYARSTVENGASTPRSDIASPSFKGLESAKAVDLFSEHFSRLFRRYWHAPVVIHGIRTTVFDYSGIASEVGQPESDYSQALKALERVDSKRLGGGDREKAFWINVYNLGAMKLAAEHYPVSSITDPKISETNPWGIRGIRVGQTQYALHQIENEILLKKFADPRIVFAVSCAAVSCPDRTDDIFYANRIDQQLDDIVRALFANSDKGLAIDTKRQAVTLSWILKADRRLFGDGSDRDMLEFIGRYAPTDDRNWLDANRGNLTVDFFEHDWGLNDIALADKKD